MLNAFTIKTVLSLCLRDLSSVKLEDTVCIDAVPAVVSLLMGRCEYTHLCSSWGRECSSHFRRNSRYKLLTAQGYCVIFRKKIHFDHPGKLHRYSGR